MRALRHWRVLPSESWEEAPSTQGLDDAVLKQQVAVYAAKHGRAAV